MNLANMKRKGRSRKKPLLLWATICLLLALGAGAATGLILEDTVPGVAGKSSVGVSQSLAITNVTAMGSSDAFLATINDDRTSFAAHIQGNNGDVVGLAVEVSNLGEKDDITFQLIIEKYDAPISCAIDADDSNGMDTDGDGTIESVVQIGNSTWISVVGGGSSNTLYITLAIEDAASPGFYDIKYQLVPVNF